MLGRFRRHDPLPNGIANHNLQPMSADDRAFWAGRDAANAERLARKASRHTPPARQETRQ